MTLTAGSKLGPYEILAPIGAGGMGEVYRAHDPRVGREVAIKVSSECFGERFEREARAVAALSHPNILAVYDVGREEDVSYAVLELLKGQTLRDRLTGGALPWREAVALGTPVFTTFAGRMGGVDEALIADGRLRVLTDPAELPLRKREAPPRCWPGPRGGLPVSIRTR